MIVPSAIGAGFVASNLRSIGKGTLSKTCDITTPSGIIFKGVMLHVRDQKRWIQVPSKEYSKGDGTKGYSPVVEFSSPARWQTFNSAALAAIDVLLAEVEGAP